MREKKQLLDFVQDREGEEFTLVTLTETEGSTYRKKGAMKVIDGKGKSVGLISGGCLEGEILEFAKGLKDNRGQLVIDTTKETDRLFGSNIGCQGKLFLQFDRLNGEDLKSTQYLGLEDKDHLKVLLVGAGPDIDPLYELLIWAGWSVQVYSSRTDLVQERKTQGWSISSLCFDSMGRDIKLEDRTALLLMSHHYPTDLEVLSQFANRGLAYIGILGPKRRRDQLFLDAEKMYQTQVLPENRDRIYGPMGMEQMGRGESAIALSIVAQLQARFFGDNQ
jgi:xanthine/CO dehydrogenase XdhC/CoxF family maturation factor